MNFDDETIKEQLTLDGTFNEDAKNISITPHDVYCYPEAYKYAMDMTERELKQAVEGMYHNLNTL